MSSFRAINNNKKSDQAAMTNTVNEKKLAFFSCTVRQEKGNTKNKRIAHPWGLLLNANAVIIDSIAALGQLLKFGEPRKL